MNFYITNGTYDYMKRFYYKNKDKYPLQFLLDGSTENVTLLYESTRKSIFGNPRKYEVVAGFGEFDQFGIYMIKHITIEKEDQEYFEGRFLTYMEQAAQLPGLLAFRFLKPKKGTDYVVFTVWIKEEYAERWAIPDEFLIPSNQVLHGDFFQLSTYTKKYWAPTEKEISERFQ